MKLIETSYPGEIFAVDFLDVKKKFKIYVGVDYFSRKAFARLFRSKESKNIIKFLEDVKNELPINTLLSDNGRSLVMK